MITANSEFPSIRYQPVDLRIRLLLILSTYFPVSICVDLLYFRYLIQILVLVD